MLQWFKKMKEASVLLRLLENNKYFFNEKELTIEDKKNLSNLYVDPKFKSLLKLWGLQVSLIREEALTEKSGVAEIKTYLWTKKLFTLLQSTVYHYHKHYANPQKWQTSSIESLVEDLQALQTIAKAESSEGGI